VEAALRAHGPIEHDVTQSIGRRYRRQDEIGTPFAVTVDFDSLQDQAVTIRERDTMEQVRVPIAGLVETLQEKFAGGLWGPYPAGEAGRGHAGVEGSLSLGVGLVVVFSSVVGSTEERLSRESS